MANQDVPVSPQATTLPPRASAALLAAVLLLSAAGLMFELTLTRIFSATIWYHFTFVAISVALFGWGMGGFLVYVLRLSRSPERSRTILVVLGLLFALALPLFQVAILQFPFTADLLPFYIIMSALPFLLGGAALSLAFESRGADVNRLYFADLVGASAGTVAVPLAIGLLGAETVVLAAGVLPALAAVVLGLSAPKGKSRAAGGVGLAVLAAVIALSAWNFQTQKLTIRDAPGKAMYKLLHDHPNASIKSDYWNAYSRITSVVGFDDAYVARLFIDSDAETSVLHWNGQMGQIPHARKWFRAFPFRLVNEPKVLVIGPGGGTDVALAIECGSPRVTAVEMNPLVVKCVREFGPAAGNIYTDHPKVNLVLEEGRSFIQRTGDRFDLIVLGWVDSWASVSSGGLSLTENYLYTKEAMRAYYDHLSPHGAVAIIRWPVDVPRLVANAVCVLSDQGMPIDRIGRHILAVSLRKPESQEGSSVETVFMLSRAELDAPIVDRLLEGLSTAYVHQAPTRPSEGPYADLFSGKITFPKYTDSFAKMATPVADDQPFYFAVDKPMGIPAFITKLLYFSVVAVLAFTVVLFVAGSLLKFRIPRLRAVGYFGALGMGFIICEVALMQRLILLRGHPIYTLVVILFVLLLASALGSFFARRFPADRIRAALGRVIPLVVLLIVLGAFVLPSLIRSAVPLELPWRIAIAAALTLPFGFLMGMPFPLGLRRSTYDPQGAPVSVLWGINGVASVLGSIGGMLLAMAAGFTVVFLAGAACYVLAWATRPR
jgi:predicted membrane-bound spermidine synthase